MTTTASADDNPTSSRPPLTLRDLDALSIEALNGVGPKRSKALRSAEIELSLIHISEPTRPY